jgi:3-oxoacyl-[acyl-carrier-protein] synthase-3
MALNLVELCSEVASQALKKASLPPNEVDFFATHQETGWLRAATQEHLGASRARSCDTFPWTGTIGPASVPLCLATAEREGLLKDGEIIAASSGGAGMTIAGIVLRWQETG